MQAYLVLLLRMVHTMKSAMVQRMIRKWHFQSSRATISAASSTASEAGSGANRTKTKIWKGEKREKIQKMFECESNAAVQQEFASEEGRKTEYDVILLWFKLTRE